MTGTMIFQRRADMTDRAAPDAASDTTDLFEIIRTTRSMRRLKPDPVPNELIRKILEAGVCAPSGGNMQRWQFLVIRDPKVKETVGALYKRAWDEQVAPRYRSGEPAPGMIRERFLRLLDAAEYLANHIHKAPVWIVPCLEGATPTRTSGSSIYPAVQNMLLAARALGLGATLTTLHLKVYCEPGRPGSGGMASAAATRRVRRSAAAGESLRHFGRGQTRGTTRPSVRSPRRA